MIKTLNQSFIQGIIADRIIARKSKKLKLDLLLFYIIQKDERKNMVNTEWIPCVVFSFTEDHLAIVKPGAEVFVEGKLRRIKYIIDDESTGAMFILQANRVVLVQSSIRNPIQKVDTNVKLGEIQGLTDVYAH